MASELEQAEGIDFRLCEDMNRRLIDGFRAGFYPAPQVTLGAIQAILPPGNWRITIEPR